MKPTQLILGMMMMFAWAAYADDSATPDANGGKGAHPQWHHPQMTEAQKACFTANGLTAPGEGRPKERPTRETMDKVHACLEKNGMKWPKGPPHGMHGHHGEGKDGAPPPPPPGGNE